MMDITLYSFLYYHILLVYIITLYRLFTVYHILLVYIITLYRLFTVYHILDYSTVLLFTLQIYSITVHYNQVPIL